MSIYKKLLEVQKEVGAISKDSKNPFFKSKYFDINQLIEHVQPVLNKHGLVLTQPIKDNNVISRIDEADGTGVNCIESSLELPELTDPQKLGSCITYYRRYTLASLLGLQAEDDDANLASKKASKPQSKPKPSAEQWKKMIEKNTTLEQAEKHFTLSDEQKKVLK